MTIHLQVEALPWLGNPHAELVEELHFHDLPLIAVILHGGQHYLSRCIIGEVEGVNVWTYTPLNAADLDAIEEVDEGTFDEVVLGIAQNSTHLAVALNGYGIVAWTQWSDFPGEAQKAVDILYGRMTRFIASLTEGTESAKAQADRLLAAV